MRKRVVLGILSILIASTVCAASVGVAYPSSLRSVVVYHRRLPFYEEMETRLERYAETSDWVWKIHPLDLAYVEN